VADYAITGKKGTGKSKAAVFLARKYLREGRRVASNLDIDMAALMGPKSKATYVRVPDKPTAEDLEAAGHGNPESYDEDKNAAMVLDELGTWLNSRTFADKARAPMIDWLAHARKHGYDVYYIMQNLLQIDKQVRESFVEFAGRVVRFDRIRIPLIGGLLNGMFGGRAGYLPRFHRLVFRMGLQGDGIVAESMWFLGDDLHKAYDTRQVFRQDYPHGTHSVLSGWHLVGRYQTAPKSLRQRIADFFMSGALPRIAPRPKLAHVCRLMSLPPDVRWPIAKRWEQKGLLDVV
jgi:Zonular occludens toxin (Zot)